MHKRTKELIEYGKLCGFSLAGLDGRDHWVMEHPSGAKVRVANSPGDYRGDRNCRAEMRRISGVNPPRPNAGKYLKGVRFEDYKPTDERVDSRSRRVALLKREFSEACAQINRCRDMGDRDGVGAAVYELIRIEETFRRLGLTPPVRKFRVWVPDHA